MHYLHARNSLRLKAYSQYLLKNYFIGWAHVKVLHTSHKFTHLQN